jgi:hypothetical protein
VSFFADPESVKVGGVLATMEMETAALPVGVASGRSDEAFRRTFQIGP